MRHIQISITFWVLSTTVVLAASAGARGDVLAGRELGRVDFRYAPPWWQSAICLPDDPDKILVGKEGQDCWSLGMAVCGTSASCFNPRSTRARPG
jgi:hypothetical protein